MCLCIGKGASPVRAKRMKAFPDTGTFQHLSGRSNVTVSVSVAQAEFEAHLLRPRFGAVDADACARVASAPRPYVDAP